MSEQATKPAEENPIYNPAADVTDLQSQVGKQQQPDSDPAQTSNQTGNEGKADSHDPAAHESKAAEEGKATGAAGGDRPNASGEATQDNEGKPSAAANAAAAPAQTPSVEKNGDGQKEQAKSPESKGGEPKSAAAIAAAKDNAKKAGGAAPADAAAKPETGEAKPEAAQPESGGAKPEAGAKAEGSKPDAKADGLKAEGGGNGYYPLTDLQFDVAKLVTEKSKALEAYQTYARDSFGNKELLKVIEDMASDDRKHIESLKKFLGKC
ncbi:MAG: hypothetical protein IAF58_23340 [Leptolyngbya sp.]|nr:hypothetical protein [Candidatus Melainabacteria bacterium]